MKYLIFATIGSVLFFGVYWLLMRKEVRFKMVRAYLVGTLALSFLLPLIHITMDRQLENVSVATPEVVYAPVETHSETIAEAEEDPVIAPGTPIILIKEQPPVEKTTHVVPWFGILYATVCAVMLLAFLIRLGQAVVKIHRLSAAAKQQDISSSEIEEGVSIVFTNDDTPAFSFMNHIVIGRADFSDEELSLLVGHEKVHVRQRHSLDIFFVELAKVVLWFNPIIWLYGRELKRVHEYLADHEMLSQGADYAELFYHQVCGHRYCALGNNFDYSITKKRINMMTQRKSKLGGLTPLFVLPIVALILFANCKTEFGLKGSFEVSRITLMSDNPQEPDLVCSEFFSLESRTFTFKPDGTVKIRCDADRTADFTGTYVYDGNELDIFDKNGNRWVSLEMKTLLCNGDSIAFQFIDPSPLGGLTKALNDFHVEKHQILTVETSCSGYDENGNIIQVDKHKEVDTSFAHIVKTYEYYDSATAYGWDLGNRLLSSAVSELGCTTSSTGATTVTSKWGKEKTVFFTEWEFQHDVISPGAQAMYDTCSDLNPKMDGDRFILQVELKKK